MALVFGTSGDRVDFGSATNLDNLGDNAFTVWAWVYRTADGANQYIASKDSAFPMGWGFVLDNYSGATQGQIRFIGFRSATSADWTDFVSSTSDTVPLNTWCFVAVAFDNAATTDRVDLYKGTLTATVAETGYALSQQGSAGNIQTDAAANLYVGGLQRAASVPFKGNIGRVGIVTRRLTLDELRAVQFATVPQAKVSGSVLLTALAGTGTQPDYSGNQNNGTVTGPTAGAGLPLGNWFGHDEAPAAATAAGSVTGAGAIGNTPAYGGATVTPGAVALTNGGAAGNTPAYGGATLTSTYALTGAGSLGNTPAHGGAALTVGAVNLQAGGLGNVPAYGAATVSLGSGPQALTGDGLGNTPAHGAATITPAAVALTNGGALGNTPAHGTPTLAPTYVIGPTGLLTVQGFGTATVAVGAATVAAGGLGNAPGYGTAVLTGGAVADPIRNPSGAWGGDRAGTWGGDRKGTWGT